MQTAAMGQIPRSTERILVFECEQGIPIISVKFGVQVWCMTILSSFCNLWSIDMIFDMTVRALSKNFSAKSAQPPLKKIGPYAIMDLYL